MFTELVTLYVQRVSKSIDIWTVNVSLYLGYVSIDFVDLSVLDYTLY